MWANTLPDYFEGPLNTPDYSPPVPPHVWQTMPEAVTFLSILLNPLFVWSMALLCLFFTAALTGIERRQVRWSVVAGLLLLLLGNVHTYDIAVAHAALAVYMLVMVIARRLRWSQALLQYAVIAVLSAAAPVWSWYAAHLDPAYLAKINTPTLSPRPIDDAAGYGLIFLLALLGLAWALSHRRSNPRLLFPVCWAVVNGGLVYAPVAFQRKMAEGLHIPLCILAAVALVMLIAPRLRGPKGADRSALLIVLAVVLALPSNALFVAGIMQQTAANNLDFFGARMPPAYLPWDEVAGINYLAEHAGEDDVVLSSSLIGNYIPAHASCRVFVGHWAETLHFAEALEPVDFFLTPGCSSRVRAGILRLADADWVYYGAYEAMLARQMALAFDLTPPDDPAADFRQATQDILSPVFSRGKVTIYQVRSETEQSYTPPPIGEPPPVVQP